MRRVITIAMLLCLAGCSSDPIAQSGPSDRLDITPTVRAACEGFFGGDPGLQTYIQLTEDARLVGVTYGELLDGTFDFCETEACFTCDFAVLNQVYGI